MIELTEEMIDRGHVMWLHIIANDRPSITFEMSKKVMVRVIQLVEVERYTDVLKEFGLAFVNAIKNYFEVVEYYERCGRLRDLIDLHLQTEKN